jgi:hypothetical protein
MFVDREAVIKGRYVIRLRLLISGEQSNLPVWAGLTTLANTSLVPAVACKCLHCYRQRSIDCSQLQLLVNVYTSDAQPESASWCITSSIFPYQPVSLGRLASLPNN